MSASRLQRFKAKAKGFQSRLDPASKSSTAVAETRDIDDDCPDDPQETPFDTDAIATINIWHGFSADGVHPLVRQEAFRNVPEDKMIQLINKGVDLNRYIPKGVEALLVAVHCWLQASERQPRYRGVDLNMQDSRGRMPLVLLAIEATDRISNLYTQENVKDEFLELLVEIWAQLDQQTVEAGCRVRPATPLIAAVKTDSGYSFHLLLSRDANTSSRADYRTALYVSAFGSLVGSYNDKVTKMDFNLVNGEELQIEDGKISREILSDSHGAIELLLTQAYGQFRLEQLSNDDPDLDQMKSNDQRSVDGYHEFLEGLDKLIIMESPTLDNEISDRKLCHSCQDFQLRAVHRQWYLHSPTARTLERSVSAGCGMCQLIKDSLLEEFEQVDLYYFSVLPEQQTGPTNYYERILVRGHRTGLSNDQDFIFGELSLAVMNVKFFIFELFPVYRRFSC